MEHCTGHGPRSPDNHLDPYFHGLDIRMGSGLTATVVAYCHSMEPPFFAVGERVDVGWPVGSVGQVVAPFHRTPPRCHGRPTPGRDRGVRHRR